MSPTAPRRVRPHEHTLVIGSSLATPAVRMVVVDAWAWRDDDGPWQVHCAIHPVLAIVAENRLRYAKRQSGEAEDFPATGPTHEAMRDLGWHYAGGAEWPEYDVLIQTEDYGIWNAARSLDARNQVHETFLAPWDPSEDPARLGEPIARLQSEARRLAESQEARDKARRATQAAPALAGGPGVTKPDTVT